MSVSTSEIIPCSITERWPVFRKASLDLSTSWLPSVTLLLNDAFSWPAIFFLLSQIRFVFSGSPGELGWNQLLLPAIVNCAILHTIAGYDRKTRMRSVSYAVEHGLALFIAFVISAVLVYGLFAFNDLIKPSRLIFCGSFAIFAIHTFYVRAWLAGALHSHHSRRALLLIADPTTAESFSAVYRRRQMPQELRVYMPDSEEANNYVVSPGGTRVWGDWRQAISDVDRESDGVIIGVPFSRIDPDFARFLAYLHFRHIPVYTLESFYAQQWRQVPAENINACWAFAQDSLLVRDSIYDYIKRICEGFLATVGLLAISPLFLAIAVGIRCESRGPAIFRQERVGRNEKIFTLFKFRTMSIGAENGAIYTAAGDRRITRLGRLLRCFRLDELPQLVNVLKGDMSLIGPRAEWVKCADRYAAQIPFYNYRHLVRPGITGWAQVNYPYGESQEDALEKLRYDLFYIRHYSLVLDLTIILKTFQVMASAKGR